MFSDCLLSKNHHDEVHSDHTVRGPPIFISPSLASWVLAENTEAQQNKHHTSCNHKGEDMLSLPPTWVT